MSMNVNENIRDLLEAIDDTPESLDAANALLGRGSPGADALFEQMMKENVKRRSIVLPDADTDNQPE